MSWVVKLLGFAVQSFLLREAKNNIRRKGVLIYLKSLQAIRRAIAGSVIIYVLLQLMIFGFLGSLVAGIFLLPEELSTKLWILFGVFMAMMLLPLIALFVLLSEKAWFKYSGAEQMLEAETKK